MASSPLTKFAKKGVASDSDAVAKKKMKPSDYENEDGEEEDDEAPDSAEDVADAVAKGKKKAGKKNPLALFAKSKE